MPRISLETADATELAELLQLLVGWLAADPATLSSSLLAYIGTPPTGWTRSAAIWTASPSSSAAATAKTSSDTTSYNTQTAIRTAADRRRVWRYPAHHL
jgi:hypothetical protein